MNKQIIFFICAIFYTEIIVYIYITNKVFIEKLKIKDLKLKIIKIKKLNTYLLEELEIIKNKNYKKILL